MLHEERNGQRDFDREKFKERISLQYRQGDELNNGKAFLERLTSGLAEAIKDWESSFDLAQEAAHYAPKGIHPQNAYLYVRGHCLYNSLLSIGKKLCEGTGADFEQNVLKSALAFEQYDAISRIKADIGMLKTIRKNY